mmetsp:Transcript_18650/g.36286  ORF Transcript_18650/g.36286 Transcript_18650/m.36286 type:complete len:86 (+) Transcript_18650:83-340(+)
MDSVLERLIGCVPDRVFVYTYTFHRRDDTDVLVRVEGYFSCLKEAKKCVRSRMQHHQLTSGSYRDGLLSTLRQEERLKFSGDAAV